VRKKKIIKGHSIKPDKKFASPIVAKLINKVMRDGEKRKATKIVYQAAQIVEKNVVDTPFLVVVEKAVANTKPGLEMKRRKIGGANYRIPQPISEERALKTVLR
jgi:small subunit ribosomal protein S7